MSDPLIDDANAISPSSPKTRTFAQHSAARTVAADATLAKLEARVAALEQPAPGPPPAAGGKLWGISPSNNPYTPAIGTQMDDYVALNVNCPRISGDDTAALAARAHGFKRWVAWITGDGSATPDQVVAYARKYPEAMVGFGNELNLNPDWSAAQVAAKQLLVYQAVKDAGLPNKVMLSNVSISNSKKENLSVLDWCKHHAAAGCTFGHGFDVFDPHMYDADPQHIDDWAHVWTPNTAGESCLSVLGNPPFYVSEFGARIGPVVGQNQVNVTSEAAQVAALNAWFAKLGQLDSCLGGAWFQLNDGTAWTGFGLIRGDGTHRPSYAAYQAAAA